MVFNKFCNGQLGSSPNRAYYNKVGYQTATDHDKVHLTYSTSKQSIQGCYS